jgi:hypothetical protein
VHILVSALMTLKYPNFVDFRVYLIPAREGEASIGNSCGLGLEANRRLIGDSVQVVGDAHSVNDVVVGNDVANAVAVLDGVGVGNAVGVAKGCAWTAELIQLVI